MELTLKKTTLALLISSLVSNVVYADTTVSPDGSFSVSDEFVTSESIKEQVDDLLNNTTLNQDELTNSSEFSGNYYPKDVNGDAITENSVLNVTSVPAGFDSIIYGGFCEKYYGGNCEVKNTNVVMNNLATLPGQSLPSVYGAESAAKEAPIGTGSIYLMGSTHVRLAYGANVLGSYSTIATAVGNVYLMDSAQVEEWIYGAQSVSFSTSNSSVTATGNVYLMDSAQGGSRIYGALSNASTDVSNYTVASTATGNVYLRDSAQVDGIIWGANSLASLSSSEPNGTGTGTVTATGNVYLRDNAQVRGDIYAASSTISISDYFPSYSMKTTGNVYLMDNAQVAGNIYAAYSNTYDYSSSPIYSSVAGTGNVYIYGNVKLQDDSSGTTQYNSSIYGSVFNNASTLQTEYNIFNNNLLSLGNAPLTVINVGNFATYNFYLNDYNKAVVNDNTSGLLTVTGSVKNNKTVNADGTEVENTSSIHLAGIAGKDIVKKGDTIVLIDASGATGGFSTGDKSSTDITNNFNNIGKTDKGIAVGLIGTADASYSVDNNKIIATIDNYNVSKERVDINVKPLAEGRLAAVQNVTRGADLLLDTLQNKNEPVGTFTPIAVISGGKNKYHSGSHINSNDYRLMVGSRYQLTDNFYTGLTLEYGRSNYNTDNESAAGKIEGSGHTYNYGISLLAKLFTPLESGNDLYMDGAFRFGRTSTKFESGDIVTGSGDIASYKSRTNYTGINLGTGFIYNLNETNSFDTSLRYLWTRLGSDSVIIDGDKINFDNASSSRIQAKEQYNYKTSDNLTFSLAGIYEYEFDGEAGANTSGISVNSPSVKGATGIMELGVKGTPITNNKDFSFNLSFKGYSGKRDGASASAFIQYNF